MEFSYSILFLRVIREFVIDYLSIFWLVSLLVGSTVTLKNLQKG